MSSKQQLLDPLIHLLEIKSISTQNKCLPEMKKARHYLVDLFNQLNFKTKILKAKKHDAIFASLINHHSYPTVLIYGHYDVQPPDPLDQWKTPPFKPVIKNNILYARGSSDDKGQLMVHVMAIKKLLEKGKLPLNVKFIIEGEEEIGSVSVEKLTKKYSKSLLACDYLVVSDGEMPKLGQPSIDISLRGLVYTEVRVDSAKQDVHSGQFGGIAENPAIILSRMITKLKDKNGKILIPGFYKNVKKLTKEESKDLLKIHHTKNSLKKEGGLHLIGGGEKTYSLNERMITRPTLDVNGMWSGYAEKGIKTIIPSSASAKISMRLVPNQDPDRIFKLFKKYVEKITPKEIKLTVTDHHGAHSYKAPTTDPVFILAKKSLKHGFGKEPLFNGMGATIGFVPIITKALGVPCLLIGFGLPDDNLHAPNEHFNLTNYYNGIKAMNHFYRNLPSFG